MSENEVMNLADKMYSRIEKNDYDGIKVDVSDEAMAVAFGALVQIAGSISNEAFSRVENIVTNVIEAQVIEDCTKMNNEAKQMEKFNEWVDKAMEGIDFTNPETVEMFTKICEQIRKNMETYFEKSHKPTNLWDRFLSVFRRN